jgi:hypothetical protein
MGDLDHIDIAHADALEVISDFAERYGKPHLYFACHAAFPLGLTADLLFDLRNQIGYKNRNGIKSRFPWEAAADIVLSPLCTMVRPDLYEMKADVRRILLKQLKSDEQFGEERLTELSIFLEHHIEQLQGSSDVQTQVLYKAQRWAANVHRAPDEVLSELVEELPFEGDIPSNYNSYQRISNIVSLLGTHVPEDKQEEFDQLSGIAAQYAQSLVQATGNEIAFTGESVRIGGRAIKVPQEGKRRLKNKSESQTPNIIEASNRMNHTLGEKTERLELTGLGLREVPVTLAELADLKTINLSHNELTTLPDFLLNMFGLEKLTLDHNPNLGMDFSFRLGSTLAFLSCANCGFNHFPPSIENLSYLEALDISENFIGNSPWKIDGLAKLRELDLSKCGLNKLPVDFAKMFPSLEYLDLRDNDFSAVPEALFGIESLDVLWLEGNPLPESIWEAAEAVGPFKVYLKRVKDSSFLQNHELNVADVVKSVGDFLKETEQSNQNATDTAITVYLASVTKDLDVYHNAAKDILVRRGCQVIEISSSKGRQNAAIAEAAEVMRTADLSIHIFQEGDEMSRDNDHPLSKAENKIAASCSREFGLPRVVWWNSPSVQLDPPYISDLRSDYDMYETVSSGARIVGSIAETMLYQIINEELDKIVSQKPDIDSEDIKPKGLLAEFDYDICIAHNKDGAIDNPVYWEEELSSRIIVKLNEVLGRPPRVLHIHRDSDVENLRNKIRNTYLMLPIVGRIDTGNDPAMHAAEFFLLGDFSGNKNKRIIPILKDASNEEGDDWVSFSAKLMTFTADDVSLFDGFTRRKKSKKPVPINVWEGSAYRSVVESLQNEVLDLIQYAQETDAESHKSRGLLLENYGQIRQQYDTDLYISYVQSDDDLVTKNKISGWRGKAGWVTELKQVLESRLTRMLGVKPKIFLSKEGDIVPRDMERSIQNSFLFMSVVSPAYLKNKFESNTIQVFERNKDEYPHIITGRSRFLKVEKDPYDSKNQPSSFNDVVGYNFWQKNSDSEEDEDVIGTGHLAREKLIDDIYAMLTVDLSLVEWSINEQSKAARPQKILLSSNTSDQRTEYLYYQRVLHNLKAVGHEVAEASTVSRDSLSETANQAYTTTIQVYLHILSDDAEENEDFDTWLKDGISYQLSGKKVHIIIFDRRTTKEELPAQFDKAEFFKVKESEVGDAWGIIEQNIEEWSLSRRPEKDYDIYVSHSPDGADGPDGPDENVVKIFMDQLANAMRSGLGYVPRITGTAAASNNYEGGANLTDSAREAKLFLSLTGKKLVNSEINASELRHFSHWERVDQDRKFEFVPSHHRIFRVDMCTVSKNDLPAELNDQEPYSFYDNLDGKEISLLNPYIPRQLSEQRSTILKQLADDLTSALLKVNKTLDNGDSEDDGLYTDIVELPVEELEYFAYVSFSEEDFPSSEFSEDGRLVILQIVIELDRLLIEKFGEISTVCFATPKMTVEDRREHIRKSATYLPIVSQSFLDSPVLREELEMTEGYLGKRVVPLIMRDVVFSDLPKFLRDLTISQIGLRTLRKKEMFEKLAVAADRIIPLLETLHFADRKSIALKKKEYDLYISYTNADNEIVSNGSAEWIDNFIDKLQKRMVVLSRNPMRIYHGKNDLQFGRSVEEPLDEALKSSLLFLAITSPAYVRSKDVQLVWERLEQLNLHQEISLDYGRVFVGEKLPSEYDQLGILGSLISYPFYEHADGFPVELDSSSEGFLRMINKLAQDITSSLKTYQESLSKIADQGESRNHKPEIERYPRNKERALELLLYYERIADSFLAQLLTIDLQKILYRLNVKVTSRHLGSSTNIGTVTEDINSYKSENILLGAFVILDKESKSIIHASDIERVMKNLKDSGDDTPVEFIYQDDLLVLNPEQDLSDRIKQSAVFKRLKRFVINAGEGLRYNPEIDIPILAMQRVMDGVKWNSKKEEVTVELDDQQGDPISVITSQGELVELLEEAIVSDLQDEMPMDWIKEQQDWDYTTQAQEFLLHHYRSQMDSVGWIDSGW